MRIGGEVAAGLMSSVVRDAKCGVQSRLVESGLGFPSAIRLWQSSYLSTDHMVVRMIIVPSDNLFEVVAHDMDSLPFPRSRLGKFF